MDSQIFVSLKFVSYHKNNSSLSQSLKIDISANMQLTKYLLVNYQKCSQTCFFLHISVENKKKHCFETYQYIQVQKRMFLEVLFLNASYFQMSKMYYRTVKYPSFTFQYDIQM